MILYLKRQIDLEEASRHIVWLGRPHVESINVALPWLEASEQQKLTKKLQFLFNDCGCLWGTPAFLITFIYFLSTKLSQSVFSWEILGISFLFGIGSALLAKFLGLRWSYWRLKVLFRSMSFQNIFKVNAQPEDGEQ